MNFSPEKVLFRPNHTTALSSATAQGTAQFFWQHVQQSLACRLVAVVIAASAVYAHTAAKADQAAIDEISALLEQGRLDQAAKRADTYAKNNPSEIQVRFLQGVIATEQGNNTKAIDIFTAISRDYPQLPEPFNNLAVLYAAQGEERKAVDVLESAIRTNPSYATAHENLGDLYARMASEAYSKALQLDDSRQALQPKLSLITQIFPQKEGSSARTEPVQVAQVTAKERQAQQAREAAQVAQAAQAEQARLAQQKQAEEVALKARHEAEQKSLKEAELAATAQLVAQQRAQEAKQAAAKPAEIPMPVQAAAPEAEPAATQTAQAGDAKATEAVAKSSEAVAKAAKETTADASATTSAELQRIVQAWAKAWEAQNMQAYFGAYSPQFKPADGSSLAQWKQQRTERTVGRPAITVQLRNVRVTDVREDSALVRFHQTYTSGALRAATQKTLQMKKEGGKWRIVSERTGG